MSKHKMIGLGLALVALIILSLFPAPSMTAAASSGPEWLLADLHVHSKKSDGSLPPDKIVELYKEKGFDILAISDHDRLTQVKADGLIIIPALEWTCPGYLKHLLMYFVQRMPTSVTDAYNQGAFICIAHPATWSWGESTDIPKDIPQEVEGYELYNGHCLSAPSWCAEK